LVIVADVARLLPRHWDGERLLRFLTGLALLALAFAANAGLTAPAPALPAPAVPAAVTTLRTTVDVPAAVPVTPHADAVPGTATAAVISTVVELTDPAGESARVAHPASGADGATPPSGGSRAPPSI
jgi:hypothetical protein